MSIHGICFDEGQSGSCGLECRGFTSGECDIAEEIVDETGVDSFLEDHMDALELAIKMKQTKYPFDKMKEVRKILVDEYGYKFKGDE